MAHGKRPKGLVRFLLLLAVLVGYFLYLSWKYDLATGGLVAALTWSFFVLCTPIADAGFLVDFPVRLITGMSMLRTELIVWSIAISLNVSVLTWAPHAYDKSFLTTLLHRILTTPWPYWSIIALCASGTFLSIRFGDEVMNAIARKDGGSWLGMSPKVRRIAMVVMVALIIWAYYDLVRALGIRLPT